jgi:hypothetical protein
MSAVLVVSFVEIACSSPHAAPICKSGKNGLGHQFGVATALDKGISEC